MRSACFSAIHWPMWWDSLKTKEKLQMRRLLEGIRNEAAARRRFAQFKACRYIYAYQFQNGRTLSQLTVPVPLRPESARKKQTESETKHVLCRDRRKVRLCGGPANGLPSVTGNMPFDCREGLCADDVFDPAGIFHRHIRINPQLGQPAGEKTCRSYIRSAISCPLGTR